MLDDRDIMVLDLEHSSKSADELRSSGIPLESRQSLEVEPKVLLPPDNSVVHWTRNIVPSPPMNYVHQSFALI